MKALVLVHGYEDEPATLAPLAAALDPSGSLALVTPRGLAHAPGGPAWFQDGPDGPDPLEVVAALATVHTAIDALAAEGIGPAEIVVGGYSQGAAVALAAAFHADRSAVGAVAVVAPFLLDPALVPWSFAAPPAGGVQIVAGADDEVVPPVLSRGVARLLDRNGVSATVIEVDGAGHRLAPLAAHVVPVAP